MIRLAFANLIINQVGLLGDGPSHYRHFTHLPWGEKGSAGLKGVNAWAQEIVISAQLDGVENCQNRQRHGTARAA
jgi:hypothetical protein